MPTGSHLRCLDRRDPDLPTEVRVSEGTTFLAREDQGVGASSDAPIEMSVQCLRERPGEPHGSLRMALRRSEGQLSPDLGEGLPDDQLPLVMSNAPAPEGDRLAPAQTGADEKSDQQVVRLRTSGRDRLRPRLLPVKERETLDPTEGNPR